MREGWRKVLHESVAPFARGVVDKLSDKLNIRVSLYFDSLFASNLSKCVCTFRSTVGDGMAVEMVASLAELVEDGSRFN